MGDDPGGTSGRLLLHRYLSVIWRRVGRDLQLVAVRDIRQVAALVYADGDVVSTQNSHEFPHAPNVLRRAASEPKDGPGRREGLGWERQVSFVPIEDAPEVFPLIRAQVARFKKPVCGNENALRLFGIFVDLQCRKSEVHFAANSMWISHRVYLVEPLSGR